jgi:hypothetical protein
MYLVQRGEGCCTFKEFISYGAKIYAKMYSTMNKVNRIATINPKNALLLDEGVGNEYNLLPNAPISFFF